MEGNAMNNQVQPKVYSVGNPWQKNRYAFMSQFNNGKGITEFGTSKGGTQQYYHLITPKDARHNFLNEPTILQAVKDRFNRKAGDLQRALTNTVASQPCCFNLFVPLNLNKDLATQLFSRLLGKEVQVHHIEIEFTPQIDESLGDQSQFGGTDADVAVFYTFGNNKKGVILIEFKYIESEFSRCGSYRDKHAIRSTCDKPSFYKTLIESNINQHIDKPDCGYLKYRNWQLLEKSKVFNMQAIQSADHCPFRFSGQQLWRNLLLAENVARVRGLDEFQFWVLSPSQNTWLWKDRDTNDVEAAIRKILTPKGNAIFARKDIKTDFVDNLKVMATKTWEKQLLRKFEEKYLAQCNS